MGLLVIDRPMATLTGAVLGIRLFPMKGVQKIRLRLEKGFAGFQ